METNNAERLFNVGCVLGAFLVETGKQEKGEAILRQAHEIGLSANLPGTEEIGVILAK